MQDGKAALEDLREQVPRRVRARARFRAAAVGRRVLCAVVYCVRCVCVNVVLMRMFVMVRRFVCVCCCFVCTYYIQSAG